MISMTKTKQYSTNKSEFPHCSQNNTVVDARLFCIMCCKSRRFESCRSIYFHYVQFHADDYKLTECIEYLQNLSDQIMLGVLK